MFRQSAAKAKRRGTSTLADRTGPRGPSARSGYTRCPLAAPGRGGFRRDSAGLPGGVERGRRRNLASGRQAVRTPFLRSLGSVFLPGQLLGSSPCAENRLVPRYARFYEAADEILGGGHGNVGLGSSGGPAGRRTLSRISAHRPDWLAAARTACIAVGVEDFPPRPLGVYGSARTSRPANGTCPACLERVRAGGPASMAQWGTAKGCPKRSKTMPQK